MSESANQSQNSNNSPQISSATAQASDAVQFKAKDIGVETAKPQDIFAKQRKEAEKKRRAERKTRKTLIIIFSIIGGLVVIGLVVWLVVWLIQSSQQSAGTPEDTPTILVTGSDEEIQTLVDAAQSAYDEQGDNQAAADAAVDAIFEEALQDEANLSYTSQVILSQIKFYFNNGKYDDARNIFENLDPSTLSSSQQSDYYNIGYIIYYDTEPERAQEYIDLVYEISRAEGNGQGGGNE